MEIKISDIYQSLKMAFPLELAEHDDNCGFLFGDLNRTCKRILISLDITDEVIEEAKRIEAELIVSHHPLFFKNSLSKITVDNPLGRKITALAKADISVISMHTNADSASGGVNDVLAELCGLSQIQNLGGGDSKMLGRIGNLADPVDFRTYATNVKKILGAKRVKILQAADTGIVKRVAVGGGSCGMFIPLAKEMGADTMITSDIRYHQLQDAQARKINLIDVGHFESENPICQKFRKVLSERFEGLDIIISEVNADFANFI